MVFDFTDKNKELLKISKKYLCNGCHDLMQKAMSFNVAVAYGKENAYRIHFWYISKNGVINIMNGSSLIWCFIFFFIINFLLYIKMSKNTDLTYY